jgi:tripartite-type tricarboxylate transporter receptor subunit TctC
MKDFAAIGQISSAPLVLVVNAQANLRTVSELVALLRAKGDKANYGSNGNGTFPHLAGELFNEANQLATTHVPYSGGPAVLTALITGDVDMSINHIPVVQGMVKAGKLHVIATTGQARSKAFPDVPTLQEQGVKGFEANAWFGVFAPAKTPTAVVARLSAALGDALGDESLRQRFIAQGDEPSFSEPAAFAAFVAAEARKWSAVIKAANVTIN